MTHPRVEIASGLIGVWRGEGRGETPRPFDYADIWEIMDLGKPFLWFVEKTSRDGAPAPPRAATCASSTTAAAWRSWPLCPQGRWSLAQAWHVPTARTWS